MARLTLSTVVLLSALGAVMPCAAQKIYTCTNAKGQRLTSDRPIYECLDREQRVLNRDGSARDVLPPSMTADERAAYEERERRQQQARLAEADAARRDRNLMTRYPNEASHEQAREAALDVMRRAIAASEKRLFDMETERKPLLNEAEFYKGRALPASLKARMDSVDATAEAQRSLIQTQRAEVQRISAFYDQELSRLKRLWAGATPGSLGEVPTMTAPPKMAPVTATGSTKTRSGSPAGGP